MVDLADLAYDTGAGSAEKLFMQGAKLLHDTRTDHAVIWLGPQNHRQVHRIYPFKLVDIQRWMSRHPGYRCRYAFQCTIRVYYVDLVAEACYTMASKGGEYGNRREVDIDTAVFGA